jgi:hypothetical protein
MKKLLDNTPFYFCELFLLIYIIVTGSARGDRLPGRVVDLGVLVPSDAHADHPGPVVSGDEWLCFIWAFFNVFVFDLF